MPWWKSKAAIWGLLALLIALGLFFWAFHYRGFLWGQVCLYFGVCTDKQWIKSILKAAGPLAPLVFIVIQALQVVFAPIPGEATGFIGGYLFGVPLGLLYSTLRPDPRLGGRLSHRPLAGRALHEAVDSVRKSSRSSTS